MNNNNNIIKIGYKVEGGVTASLNPNILNNPNITGGTDSFIENLINEYNKKASEDKKVIKYYITPFNEIDGEYVNFAKVTLETKSQTQALGWGVAPIALAVLKFIVSNFKTIFSIAVITLSITGLKNVKFTAPNGFYVEIGKDKQNNNLPDDGGSGGGGGGGGGGNNPNPNQPAQSSFPFWILIIIMVFIFFVAKK